VIGCLSQPNVYSYDPETDQLQPADNIDFNLEVYEQGRIHDLRADVDRQLEMLDEFAGLGALKTERLKLVDALMASATALAPLYEEREQIASGLAGLPALETELGEKEQLLPQEDRTRWANAETLVAEIEGVTQVLTDAAAYISDQTKAAVLDEPDRIGNLFGRALSDFAPQNVVEASVLSAWHKTVGSALQAIAEAGAKIIEAIEQLGLESKVHQDAWRAAKAAYDRVVSERLKEAGVESPKELIARVVQLRARVLELEKVKRPRLKGIKNEIDEEETKYSKLLTNLDGIDTEISQRRRDKDLELTNALGEHVQIRVQERGNRHAYGATLERLASVAEGRIRNRDEQLGLVVECILPIQLRDALVCNGVLVSEHGTETTLEGICGITENTRVVLCSISRDIKRLTELATVEVADVPEILVRRRGEESFADLRTKLSPGEQSAAILALALQTRAAPLILDQPEDELGYSYVVHMIVPKLLSAKFSRQLLVVTHNANIPVLGDADFVIRMENHPISENDRRCVAAVTGSFETPAITDVLLELEGGAQAFQYRQYRYSIPHPPG
jgi:ABC-type molybdenum transport system ATPase subunit/photorepair protein PhrA